MSILRYFNKHHGWYDGKRTPFSGAEEVIAAEVIAETVAPEVVGGTLAAEGGAFVPAAGASFLIPEGAAYGVGAGVGEGALYGGSELATEQAAQEAARQAAIQNAGNSQLANVPANQFASGPATSDVGGFQSQQELVNQIANATPNQMVPNNPLPPGYENLASNAPASSAIGSGGGTFGINAAPTAGTYGVAGSQVPTLTTGLGATAAPGAGIGSFMPSANQLMVGGGLYALNSMMNQDRNRYGVPAAEKYNGPLNKMRYDPNTYQYNAPVNRQYTPNYNGYARTGYAEGGITDIDQNYAKGGIAGLLKGRGDGMSDSIQATIADKQPARLADGEFVVPADVVSHLGNGSTDAGAKHLYKMMDKVRHARTGSKKQGKQIKAGGYLPIK
jgi:hypothetical protein